MRNRMVRALWRFLGGTVWLAGTGLGLAFAVLAVARRSKPLHPVGAVQTAVLVVTAGHARSGSPLLDEPGEHHCVTRASYALGSGPEHADIEGFALRVLVDGANTRITDVLFASTGTGPLGRHLLAVRRAGEHAVQSTLMPVRAGGHPLQLRLEPLDPLSQPWPRRYQLSWAHGKGPWHPFGELTVARDELRDAPVRFDPVAHPLAGTSQYSPLARLREPAYRLSRLARPSAGRLPY